MDKQLLFSQGQNALLNIYWDMAFPKTTIVFNICLVIVDRSVKISFID
jgi:hypothetical protein